MFKTMFKDFFLIKEELLILRYFSSKDALGINVIVTEAEEGKLSGN